MIPTWLLVIALLASGSEHVAEKEGVIQEMSTEIELTLISATKLYQDSSGGDKWDSVNHIDRDYEVPTSFRGYRVYAAEQNSEHRPHYRGFDVGFRVIRLSP